jgi:hypothetical protein
MKRQSPWLAVLLAVVSWAASGAARANVTITMNAHGGTKPVRGKLLAASVGSATGEKITVPLERGSVGLGLSKGSWQVSGQIEGYFVVPTVLVVITGEEQFELSAWPTAKVHGKLVVPAGEVAPQLLELRWAAVEGNVPPMGGTFCGVEKGEWQCEVPAGKLDLRVRGKGYLTHFRWGSDLKPGGDLNWGEMKLQRGASVVGWIAFGRSARGKNKDVRVVLRSAVSDPPARGAATVAVVPNERGFFELSGLAPGSYTISAEAPGPLVTESREVKVSANAEAELTTALVLEQPHKVQVQIDPPKPPAGDRWTITLFSYNEMTHHQDVVARNSVEVTGLWGSPGIRPGSYVIQVGSGDSQLVRQEFRMENADNQIAITVPLTHVHGSVKLGDRALSATVWIGGKHGSPTIPLTTDDDGAFSGDVSLVPGKEWAVTIDSEHPRVERTVRQTPVAESGGSLRLDIAIPNNGMHGIVVDGDGHPVGPAIINIATPDPAQAVVQTHGDKQGAFDLVGLLPGHYTAEAMTFDHRQSKPTPVEVDPANGSSEVKLVVEGQSLFSGRVLSEASPVPGTGVTLVPTNTDVAFMPNATTNADGEFNVALPPGVEEGNLIVAAPGFSLKMFHLKLSAEPLNVRVDANGGALELDVPPFVADSTVLQSFIVHRGAELNAQFIAYTRGVKITSGEDGWLHIIHPLMESGEYALCSGMMSDRAGIRAGVFPQGRCVSGVLAPFGSLKLKIPKSTADTRTK